jgi:hypothetical protein
LSEAQFERLRPLPDNVRGVARVDDRRVISGIIRRAVHLEHLNFSQRL